MQKNLKLVSISSAFVLSAGLFGCNSNISGQTKGAFYLNEPRIRRSGLREIRLSDDLTNVRPFTTSDEIVFSANDVRNGNIQISLNAHCNADKGETQILQQSWALKSSLRLFEIIPREVLFSSQNPSPKKINCRFNFTAKRDDGATHSFSITLNSIEISDGNVAINFEGGPVASAAKIPASVFKNRSGDYSLPALNNPDDSYLLQCEHSTGLARATPFEIRLDQFTKNSPATTEAPLRELCRIFYLDGNNRTLGITDLINIRKAPIKIDVVKLSQPANAKTESNFAFDKTNFHFVETYRVTNLSDEALSIVVPYGDGQPFGATLILNKSGRQIWANDIFKSQGWAPHIALGDTTHFRFTLAPGEAKTFTFGPILGCSQCTESVYVTAFRFSPHSRAGLVFFVLADLHAAVEARSIEQTVQFEPYFEKWAAPTDGALNWALGASPGLRLDEENKSPESLY